MATTLIEQYKTQYKLLISIGDQFLKINSIYMALFTAAVGYFTSIIMDIINKKMLQGIPLYALIFLIFVIFILITYSWIISCNSYIRKEVRCEKVIDEIEANLPSSILISREQYKTKERSILTDIRALPFGFLLTSLTIIVTIVW